jgi:hypothetical protein
MLFGGGKNAKQEILPGPGARTSLTSGSPLSRMMGQYGKGHSYLGAGMEGGASDAIVHHSGVSQIRGAKGGVRSNPRTGALGPGPRGAPGTAQDYSMQTQDTE